MFVWNVNDYRMRCVGLIYLEVKLNIYWWKVEFVINFEEKVDDWKVIGIFVDVVGVVIENLYLLLLWGLLMVWLVEIGLFVLFWGIIKFDKVLFMEVFW